jgi:signal transduction protein with GAF and PtsI domain
MLIVDGTRGVLIVDPDAACSRNTACAAASWSWSAAKLKRLKNARRHARRRGHRAAANIELPGTSHSVKNGAAGIGLFRTEFLFLNRDDLPGEDEQFEAYRSVAEGHGGPAGDHPHARPRRRQGAARRRARLEANPALGLRAIRYCLAEPQMFLTQLRAILRASAPRQRPASDADAGARARDRPDAGDDRAGQGPAARRAKRQVRRGHRGRRHDRDPRRGAGARPFLRRWTSSRSAPTT